MAWMILEVTPTAAAGRGLVAAGGVVVVVVVVRARQWVL